MRATIIFLRDTIFPGIPNEIRKGGIPVPGEIVKIKDFYVYFIPDDTEREYAIPIDLIDIEYQGDANVHP